MKQRFLWPTTQRRRWLLICVLLIGTALRLWLWWRSPLHQAANDETEYVAVARDLLAGRGWQFYEHYHWLRAPLYPLWLAGSLWLFDDLRLASLPNIALSSATIYLFYLLGREVGLSGRAEAPERIAAAERVGLLSAASAALLFTLATFASLWMAETLFTALFAGALLLLLRCVDRPRLWLGGAAGVLLGLAILTRSSPLPLVPLAALWLAWNVYRRRAAGPGALRSGLLYGAVFVLCCGLTIAPWTIRNYLAYGEPIAVETGLSYNLWAFNEPREDDPTIFKTLESIPSPAERADYATSKGLARLREDPTILLRKLRPNWESLWVIEPIEDRFLLPTYYQDVPLGVFALALLLDDALYIALALLGLWGLLCAPLDRRKLLLGGWVLALIGVVLLTHGEGRYRQFIFPVLLPYAAWMIVALRRPARKLLGVKQIAALLAIVAVLWTAIVVYYPREWAVRNLRRGWAVLQAERALRNDDATTAIGYYQWAHTLDPASSDVWLDLAAVYRQLGQPEQALAALDNAFTLTPSYVTVNLRRGDTLRHMGRTEDAREAFKGFYNDEQQMIDWAWTDLDSPPPAVVEVGDGLDFGFISGMYPAESQQGRQVRWTDDQATLKLAGSATGGQLTLTLAAPWPGGEQVPVRVCVNDGCTELVLQAAWREYRLSAPPAQQYRVTLQSPTFSPQQLDAETRDQRRLGLLIDQAAVEPLAR